MQTLYYTREFEILGWWRGFGMVETENFLVSKKIVFFCVCVCVVVVVVVAMTSKLLPVVVMVVHLLTVN